MRMTSHDKLVRDRIPEIIRMSGRRCVTRVLSEAEYLEKLDEKLNEEVREYRESHSIEELADVLEILHAITVARGYTLDELERARMAKAERNGVFAEKIYLMDSWDE